MTTASQTTPLTRLYTLHALTPLHAGTGQGVGDIDLPVARERATGLPFVPGSSVRGVLRDAVSDKEDRVAVFGPDTANASDFAGAINITDARLLLFPVRSVAGTWAWATSPALLARLKRDAAVSGMTALPAVPQVAAGQALLSSGSLLKLKKGPSVLLDDWQLTVSDDVAAADAWAAALSTLLGDDAVTASLRQRLCLLDDTQLSLTAELATEVNARIRLNEKTKTVERGALWYEESLPSETVLFGLMRAEGSRGGTSLSPRDVLGKVGAQRYAQFGGKAGTGRGLCSLRLNLEGPQ